MSHADGKSVKNIIKRMLQSFLGSAMVICSCLWAVGSVSFTSYAAGVGGEIVRVGWFQSDLFQEGMSDDEEKYGYCYDYLQALTDYTDWKYEYVYGDWGELYRKLEKGEIDFMAGMSMTEERKETMIFPKSAMGTDRYLLYKHMDDESINPADLATFEGKKVGLVRNNRMTYFAEQWIEDNGLEDKLEKVYFDGITEMDAAFDKEAVDLITRTLENASNTPNIETVVNLGEEPYYIAVNKSRKDLADELDEAANAMTSVNPYILLELQKKNYGTSLVAKNLSSGEKNWLSEHEKLKIGYMNNYLPYSACNAEGEAEGIVTDVLEAALSALAIEKIPEIEYTAYNGYDELVSALRSGEIDAAFPVADDPWRLEQDGINATAEVITDRGALFYKDIVEKGDIKKVAVNENNVLQRDYTNEVYPDAEIVYYQNIKGCLDAVVRGDVDGTIMDTLRVQYVTSKPEYDSLSYVQLGEGTGKCFGINKGNRDLLLIFNRGIKSLRSTFGYDSSYQYMDSFYDYSAATFIKRHLALVSFTLVCVIGIIILLLMTNIRRQAAEIREKEELKKQAETANAAKSTFLFNMSHDIRTPMNAVMGFTALMEKSLDDKEKLRAYLKKIRISGDYLLNLINNVLEVAKIDSGKETLDEGFVDLGSEKYIVIFENEISKKHLEVTTNLDIDHRYVYADAGKIREIVSNLLSNAVKYTQDGGRIFAEIREVPCERAGYARYIATVSDNGVGMTKEFQEHIFELFSRERNSTDSKVAGTGLGMSIVKKLVDLMNGTIEVESEPGKGSTFRVTVELRIVEEPEKYLENKVDAVEKEQIDLSGRRLLVAEDNELNAEIAEAVLTETGAKVDIARDGVECVDMIYSHEAGFYDIVIMDIQMPNLNGYEAAKRIRSLDDTEKASIPIIAMTANAFEEDKRAAFDAGMNGHVAKPIDVEKLMATLGSLLK